jgi:hypothetical protein
MESAGIIKNDSSTTKTEDDLIHSNKIRKVDERAAPKVLTGPGIVIPREDFENRVVRVETSDGRVFIDRFQLNSYTLDNFVKIRSNFKSILNLNKFTIVELKDLIDNGVTPKDTEWTNDDNDTNNTESKINMAEQKQQNQQKERTKKLEQLIDTLQLAETIPISYMWRTSISDVRNINNIYMTKRDITANALSAVPNTPFLFHVDYELKMEFAGFENYIILFIPIRRYLQYTPKKDQETVTGENLTMKNSNNSDTTVKIYGNDHKRLIYEHNLPRLFVVENEIIDYNVNMLIRNLFHMNNQVFVRQLVKEFIAHPMRN